MTSEQILGIAQTATGMLEARPTEPAAPAAPPTPAFEVADDEYLTGRQFKDALAARPIDDTALRFAADNSLAIIRSQFASDFTKYGAEIDAYVARIPIGQRTIDNLKTVVKMVRSDHVDEIAAERAQQLASQAPTLRPNGGGSAPAPVSREFTLESEQIPQEWKDRARAAKISEHTVDEFCRANGMTPTEFYKQFDKPLNAIVGDVRQRYA